MKTIRQHFEHLTERAHEGRLSAAEPQDDFDPDEYLQNKYGDASNTTSGAITEPTIDSNEPKFDRLNKSADIDFRKGLVGDTDTGDTDEFMVDPNPYMQSWGGKYARGDAATPQWRYVLKGEDPERYGSEPKGDGLPDLKYDPQSRTLKPADAIALDLSKDQPKYRFNRFTQQQELVGDEPEDTDTEVKQTTWREIYQLNRKTIGPDPRLIRPGQQLKMPNGLPDYTVQKGDSLVKIATQQSRDEPLVKRPKRVHTPTPVQRQAATITPTPGNIQPRVTANTGLNFPPNDAFSLGKGEEIITPALLRAQAQAKAQTDAYEKKQRDRAERQQAAKRSMKEHGPEFMKHLRDYIAEVDRNS